MTALRTHRVSLLVVAVALSSGIAFTQDNPNRPPWAQKSKSNSSTNAEAKTGSTSPSPEAPPVGEPGKIVQPTPPAEKEIPQDAEAQRNRIRVNVNLVTVLVSVLDEHNRPAPDLPREAFQLFDEGNGQKIDIFEPETSQPLDLALMMNAAVSMRLEMATEREAASRFIQQVLRPNDRLAVFSMDESVNRITPFSNRVGELQSAVRGITSEWGISLNDAVYLGAQALDHQGGDRRRVIILLTDAREATSHFDFDSARKEAVRANVLLYTVIIRPVKNENGRNTAGEHALATITDTTGGAMFFPDTAQDLTTIFDRIDRELRTQYRLAYYPNPRGPANTYRSITVKVTTGNYQVRHRRSYLTAPQ